MKIFAEANNSKDYYVVVSKEEWMELAQAAGLPYERWHAKVGAEVSTKEVGKSVDALRGLRDFRKSLAKELSKWDAIAARMDAVIAPPEDQKK